MTVPRESRASSHDGGGGGQASAQGLGLSVTFADLLAYVLPGTAFLSCILLVEVTGARTVALENRAPLRLPVSDAVDLAQRLENPHRLVFDSADVPAQLPAIRNRAAAPMPQGNTGNAEVGSTPDNSLFGAALRLIVLLVVAYVVGHGIAAGASLGIDGLLIGKGIGYPYKTLLRFEEGDPLSYAGASSAFWRGFLGWGGLYIVARYGEFLSRASQWGIEAQARHIAAAISILAICVILGKLILDVMIKSKIQCLKATLSSSGSRPTGVDSVQVVSGLAQRIRTLTREHAAGFFAGVTWVIVYLWAGPFDFVGVLLVDALNTEYSFSDHFVEKWCEKFEALFLVDSLQVPPPNEGTAASRQERIALEGTNVFWLAYGYAAERSRRSHLPVVGWVRKFIFARNLAFALFCATIYGLIWLIINVEQLEQASVHQTQGLVCLVLLLGAMTAVMMVRFYHLYASRFTKGVLRLFLLVG